MAKLSRLCTKHTIHWKTFAVHQAHAIMYCTQQMIQGENFRDWLNFLRQLDLLSLANRLLITKEDATDVSQGVSQGDLFKKIVITLLACFCTEKELVKIKKC